MNYNQKVGQFGEKLAKDYLQRQGYKILKTNLKVSYKELDIIAEKSDFLVFVEVKTRTSGEFPGEEATGYYKKKSFRYAISRYLTENNLWERESRADLIVVDIDRSKKIAKIKHYKDIL